MFHVISDQTLICKCNLSCLKKTKMTALTSIWYFCVNNSSFMIVIVSGRKYVSVCSADNVGFYSTNFFWLFHPLPCCMPLPSLLFWSFAPLHYTFHKAEGIVLIIVQVLGSVLEVDCIANVKTEGPIWSNMHFVCFHYCNFFKKRYQKKYFKKHCIRVDDKYLRPKWYKVIKWN